MQRQLTAIAFVCALAAAGAAHAQATSTMTRDQHKAAEDQIEATYKADKKACDAMNGNAKDVCEKEAKGKEKIAKAELEQQYKPSERNARKVAETKADVAYDVAKEKCEDLKGDAQKSCEKDAKAQHDTAKQAAKTVKPTQG